MTGHMRSHTHLKPCVQQLAGAEDCKIYTIQEVTRNATYQRCGDAMQHISWIKFFAWHFANLQAILQ